MLARMDSKTLGRLSFWIPMLVLLLPVPAFASIEHIGNALMLLMVAVVSVLSLFSILACVLIRRFPNWLHAIVALIALPVLFLWITDTLGTELREGRSAPLSETVFSVCLVLALILAPQLKKHFAGGVSGVACLLGGVALLCTVPAAIQLRSDIMEGRQARILYLAAHGSVSELETELSSQEGHLLASTLSTALERAIEERHSDAFQSLLRHGGKLTGLTLLQAAIEIQDTNLFETLLNQGTDTNAPDKDGLRPLHYAIRANRTDFMKQLIEKSADPNMTSSGGATPLQFLGDMLDFDLNANPAWRRYKDQDPDERRDAFKKVLDLLLQHGARLSLELFQSNNENRITLLQSVAAFGSVEEFRYLFRKYQEAGFSARDCLLSVGDQGNVLHLAVKRTRVDTVELLLTLALDAKLDVKAFINSRGGAESLTPLYLAVSHMSAAKKYAIVERLLKEGADPRLENRAGESALEYAQREYRSDSNLEALFNAALNSR